MPPAPPSFLRDDGSPAVPSASFSTPGNALPERGGGRPEVPKSLSGTMRKAVP